MARVSSYLGTRYLLKDFLTSTVSLKFHVFCYLNNFAFRFVLPYFVGIFILFCTVKKLIYILHLGYIANRGVNHSPNHQYISTRNHYKFSLNSEITTKITSKSNRHSKIQMKQLVDQKKQGKSQKGSSYKIKGNFRRNHIKSSFISHFII